jgi:DNA-binding response OmpR family regulator
MAFVEASSNSDARSPRRPLAGMCLATTITGDGGDVKRVLVVDDDDDVRAATASFLGDDFEVATAEDGREGLAMITAFPPDAVVLDVEMPFMDGIALMRALHAQGCDVPVLLTSGREDIAPLAKALGAFAALRKPFPIALLRAKLRAATGLAEGGGQGGETTKRLDTGIRRKGPVGRVA